MTCQGIHNVWDSYLSKRLSDRIPMSILRQWRYQFFFYFLERITEFKNQNLINAIGSFEYVTDSHFT